MPDFQPIAPALPPLEPAYAPRGVAVEALPEGGARVVFRGTTPAVFGASLLSFGVGAALVAWAHPAAALPSASLPLVVALALGLVLAAFGLLVLALSSWAFFTVVTCVATPGRLDVFRGAGGLRPRLVASLGEGPIEAVRTRTRHDRPGLLCVQVRVPFVDETIALYHGEADAAWVAGFLAKECGWQAFVSTDAGDPDPRA